MRKLKTLIEQNRHWAQNVTKKDPNLFIRLAKQQQPKYLWIGCSDSRIPASQILGLLPGELFVHRNIANMMIHSDLSCLSVLQYAVDVLKVRDIIVCGHYDCGGVKAAMTNTSYGLIDNWLRHIQDVKKKHHELLSYYAGKVTENDVGQNDFLQKQHALMCELNAIEQATNLTRTSIIQEAWNKGMNVAVHAVMYSVSTGLLQQLAFAIESSQGAEDFYSQALEDIRKHNKIS